MFLGGNFAHYQNRGKRSIGFKGHSLSLDKQQHIRVSLCTGVSGLEAERCSIGRGFYSLQQLPKPFIGSCPFSVELICKRMIQFYPTLTMQARQSDVSLGVSHSGKGYKLALRLYGHCMKNANRLQACWPVLFSVEAVTLQQSSLGLSGNLGEQSQYLS